MNVKEKVLFLIDQFKLNHFLNEGDEIWMKNFKSKKIILIKDDSIETFDKINHVVYSDPSPETLTQMIRWCSQ